MKKSETKQNEQGITLVALLITIIILVILVAVTIKITMDAHIIGTSINGAEKYSIKMMEENEIFKGTEKLLEEALRKLTSVGAKNENINLKKENKFNEDYTIGTIHVEVEYEGIIESIHINNKEIKVPEKTNGVYIIEDEVTENGMYVVIAKDVNGDYQITNVKVSEIIGNMKIYDEEDMELFRERVNEGKVFASTKVEVMKDITLTKEWEPIGTEERQFLGEFEGNGYTIKALEIKGKGTSTGLFSYNSGIIKNLKIEGDITSEAQYTGMLVGINNGTIEKVTVSGEINAPKGFAGGICSLNYGTIDLCKNKSKIEGAHWLGGIAVLGENGKITRSCNLAEIRGTYCISGIGTVKYVEECYNAANIYATSKYSDGYAHVGGIVSSNSILDSYIKSCYNIGTISRR